MREYIPEIMHKGENGLYLCELPTGNGKTYNVVQAIRDFAPDSDCKRKIIFLTTLIKNLPEEDLLAAFGGDEELYHRHVLRIRSNFDEVTERLEGLEVPEEFRTAAYDALLDAVRLYNKAAQLRVTDEMYMSDLRKHVEQAEYVFRKEIGNALELIATKEQRLDAIANDDRYHWIGELYPAVFTDDHQILLMTVNKFMTRNSVLVEPSYEFLTSEMVENAIIFIDEVDATKATIQSTLIEEAIRSKEEYLELFRQILRRPDPGKLSSDLTRAYQRLDGAVRPQYTYRGIYEEADRIAEKYSVELSYKTVENVGQTRQNFLFHDTTYHTVTHKDWDYIRGCRNHEENRVDLHLEKRKVFLENREDSGEDYIPIYALLREINRFLGHYRRFILWWAQNYCEEINGTRGSNEDRMTLDDAIDTILSRMGHGANARGIILRDMKRVSSRRRGMSLLPDISYYQRGMEIFALENGDHHNDATWLNLTSMTATPEKIMAYLARKAMVVGISATAELPTVVGNYDLGYLENCLEDAYHPTPRALHERAEAEMAAKRVAYQDGRVRLHAEMVRDQSADFDLQRACEEIFYLEDYAAACARKISMTTGERYYQLRYCNIARAMQAFVKSGVGSMLYLGMALPKANDPHMHEGLLREMFDLVLEDYGLRGGEHRDPGMSGEHNLVVLQSKNFEQDKEELLRRLAQGERIMIMSTYQTIGAGQNLQYPIPADAELTELVPSEGATDKRYTHKDIDAIYLGDITHLTTNTYAGSSIQEKELLRMLCQIEELQENAEISLDEADRLIRLAFRASSGDSQGEYNTLYKAPSVQMQATGLVMQAVGRMCRTNMKSRHVIIMIEERLLEKVSAAELRRHVLPPEMEAIAQLRDELGTEYTDEERLILNRAEKTASYGMWKIRQVLSRDWTDDSMELWRQLRRAVLWLPTAGESEREIEPLIKELYITSGKEQNRYLYSQFGDFREVLIDFGDDKAAFRESERAKRRADGRNVAVYEMSEEESGLPAILRYPGMREMFEANRYATSFVEAEYMMSPVLFHNIYKGALGEVAGKFILESNLVHLTEITDPERFEYFDYELRPGVYVDFKNWKGSYSQDRAKAREEIAAKLDAIGGSKVLLINIIGDPEQSEVVTSADGRIVEIPCLIDMQGQLVYKFMDVVMGEYL